MPKASKEDTLKKKTQARALYALGRYTKQEVYEKAGITNKTLDKWINENPNDVWQVGIQVNDTREVVNEKIAPKIINKLNELNPPQTPPQQNKYDIAKSTMIDRQNQINALTEAFMEDIETNVHKTAYLGIVRMQELLLKNKSYYQGKEQTVGYENARNLDCIANATHKFAQILGLVSGNGININNINAQQNNNTSEKVDTQFNRISEQEAFQEFCKKIT